MTLIVSTTKLAQEIKLTMTGSVTAPSSTSAYKGVVTMLEAKMNSTINFALLFKSPPVARVRHVFHSTGCDNIIIQLFDYFYSFLEPGRRLAILSRTCSP